VIESFRHKGLERLYEEDSGRGLNAEHVGQLRLILSALDVAGMISDMDQPEFELHQLKGKRRGIWAVTVPANWRVTFRFADGRATEVDYEDYHWKFGS
jgi:proteic killer suppression protein